MAQQEKPEEKLLSEDLWSLSETISVADSENPS
jgi:hypothetical protein